MAQRKCYTGQFKAQVSIDGCAQVFHRIMILTPAPLPSEISQSRRVVAKIEWHAGELFPSVGFIVTNLRWKSSNVVKFYNKRGTAEQWIKEGKYALNWTRLSCHDFADNQVRLQLFALAYNLGNFLRRLALPKRVKEWSLRTLQVKLIKIGAKVVRHSRYVIFQMAEVMVSKSLFHEILAKIHRLKPVPIGYG